MKLIELRPYEGKPRGRAKVDDEDYETLVSYGEWTLQGAGYAWCRAQDPEQYGQRRVFMHRMVMGLVPRDGLHVDHVDRDKLNNQRSNLRVGTVALNRQNVPSRPGSSSRFRGVWWCSTHRRWRIHVAVNGRQYRRGKFESEIEAAMAAQALRRDLMPFAEPDPALAEALAEPTPRVGWVTFDSVPKDWR